MRATWVRCRQGDYVKGLDQIKAFWKESKLQEGNVANHFLTAR